MSKIDKDHLIDKILENTVYLPESGMIQNLRKTLAKLSRNDLDNLSLVIELSRQKA